MRPVSFVLLTVAVAMFVAGCGGRTTSRITVTPTQVRSTFGSHGFQPDLVFDAGTATLASIDRLFPTTSPIAEFRKVNAAQRAGAEEEAFQAALGHPLTLYSFPSGSPDGGDIAAYVFSRTADAKAVIANVLRVDAKFRREGDFVTPEPAYNSRIGDVVIDAGSIPMGDADRLLAVEADLRSLTQH